MLRSGRSSRMARATPSTSIVPGSQSSDKKEVRDQADQEEDRRGLTSLVDALGAAEYRSGDHVGPTVASSAYLTRVTFGPLGGQGDDALRPRQEMEGEVRLFCLGFVSC